ncbi:MAG: M48 family peptidase, partial [Fulvivirga sp.]
MASQTILYLILGIITFSYLLNQLLDYLNLKSRKSELPDDIKSFYSEEKYAKAQEYHKTLSNFSF